MGVSPKAKDGRFRVNTQVYTLEWFYILLACYDLRVFPQNVHFYYHFMSVSFKASIYEFNQRTLFTQLNFLKLI